ncbi:hypothetical protein ACLKA6_005026 [Drosophila palustris]
MIGINLDVECALMRSKHVNFWPSSSNRQQRMTTPPPQHTSLPIGSATNHNNNNNNSSSNNTHSINQFGGSNVARGGIEATTLKYGNTGSGSYKGGGDLSNSSCTTSSTMSSMSCSSLNSHSNDHHQHYQYQLQQQQTPRCPHHVPLPDSEYGQDRHLQIRSSYQQSEITRSYTKPPPNKTVRDVPEQVASPNCNYRLTSANSCSTLAANVASSSSTYALAITHGQAATTKSKPNAITKFFSRISSPKSPTSLATGAATGAGAGVALATGGSSLASSASMSSSASSLASSAGIPSSCVSASSSASSLAAAPLTALPICNASTLKSTACSFGSTTATTTTTAAGSLTPQDQEQQLDETQ